MVEGDKRQRKLEISFLVVFSIVVFSLFYFFLGANGLIIGNDSAIHIQRAQMFLQTGIIPISDIAWYPPLYHILLSTFIAFTGATSVEQMITAMKLFTALVDWLLVFSVYLITAKFFNKKAGVFAAALILLCVPLYNINAWGGYTGILSLAFMALAFAYLAAPLKGTWSALVTFALAFSLVMSHQLATFLSVFILPPFVIIALARSKGHYRKALIAALLGGGIAFGIYYLRPILPYLGELVNIIFFQLQTMLYQIPTVSFEQFMMNFGFLLFLSFAGLAIAFMELRKKKSLSYFLLLSMAFLVPLFLSQSYLVGLLLPYEWFTYYLMPFMAVFAGVTLAFVMNAVLTAYRNNRRSWRKIALKALSVAIVCVLVAVMVVRFQTVTAKIGEDTVFYSMSDMSAYQAGTWVKQNYPDPTAKVVARESPGSWFGAFSGKPVIAETNPVIEWNYNAECILDLSYEIQTYEIQDLIQNPLTMVRTYDAKGNISSENYIMMNMVWHRISFAPENEAYVAYHDQNDSVHTCTLSSLDREVSFNQANSPNQIVTEYSAPDFILTEKMQGKNDTYPITVEWQLTANTNLTYVTLFLSEYFDPNLKFDQAYLAQTLNWETPWNNASKVDDAQWAVTDFTKGNLTVDNHIDAYDSHNQTGFAFQFNDLPDSGNIGSLSNKNVDAVRFQYNFNTVNANQTAKATYQFLTFSTSSYPELENYREMNTLFDSEPPEPIGVIYRSFSSVAQKENVVFVVYDTAHFDPNLLKSKWVELVYSNNNYVVLKTKIALAST